MSNTTETKKEYCLPLLTMLYMTNDECLTDEKREYLYQCTPPERLKKMKKAFFRDAFRPILSKYTDELIITDNKTGKLICRIYDKRKEEIGDGYDIKVQNIRVGSFSLISDDYK